MSWTLLPLSTMQIVKKYKYLPKIVQTLVQRHMSKVSRPHLWMSDKT